MRFFAVLLLSLWWGFCAPSLTISAESPESTPQPVKNGDKSASPKPAESPQTSSPKVAETTRPSSPKPETAPAKDPSPKAAPTLPPAVTAGAASTNAQGDAGGTSSADAENDTKQEGEEPQPVKDAWEVMWTGQQEMLNEMRETALRLSDSFAGQTQDLSEHLKPFEREGRRLLVFVNTFKGFPNPLEAVNRRIGATIADIQDVLQPVTLARAEAESLLERVNYMSSSLPDDVDRSHLSTEMQAYINDMTRARLRLTAVLAQYDSLAPSFTLIKKLEQTRAQISQELPELWKNYYLQKPVPWLSPTAWENFSQEMYYSWHAMILRLPVEIPANPAQWSTAALRFFIGLLLAGVFSLLLRQRWQMVDPELAKRGLCKKSIPLLCLGFAFAGSALSTAGEFFRYFLALACVLLILGEIFLAWDLREIQYPGEQRRNPPFLKLLPLAFFALAIFYIPRTPPLMLLLWLVAILLCLFRRKYVRHLNLGAMQMESGVMECYPIVLWICLFVVVSGFHLYSIGLYLAYVAFSVALELSLGGMSIISRINEHLPQEGARAVLARLLVALAAPFVLVLAVAGVCLWIAILPGGTYLLGDYALKGVTVGATQFNIIQILLIISVFYLTRTVVSMGTRFLTKLPQLGSQFDATLITPMQTALTYTAWAIFGLFVLRSLGMELNSLAMVAGGLSVGIGFGMQTIVNNFLSGLILIFGRTLQVGDVVEVGGTTGRVRKISVRATMVETYSNAMIYVPNSEFMSGRLINWTSFSRSVRQEVQVGVAYGSDTEKAIKLLISVAKENENVLKFPVPSVNFADFAASSLDFRLRFWVRDYDLGASTSSQIRLAINAAFNEAGIEIAFPQLDVHLKDMPGQTCAASLPPPEKRALPRTPRRPAPLKPIRRKIPQSAAKSPAE